MTCALCHNGTLHAGTADKALTHAGMTLVVTDVPAMICDTCGERYFDETITHELLGLARDAVAAGVVVDVRRYAAA